MITLNCLVLQSTFFSNLESLIQQSVNQAVSSASASNYDWDPLLRMVQPDPFQARL